MDARDEGHQQRGATIRSVRGPASDAEGLRRVLTTTVGDRYRVQASDDGSVVEPWRRTSESHGPAPPRVPDNHQEAPAQLAGAFTHAWTDVMDDFAIVPERTETHAGRSSCHSTRGPPRRSFRV